MGAGGHDRRRPGRSLRPDQVLQEHAGRQLRRAGRAGQRPAAGLAGASCEREGKLGTSGGSIRDLVLGSARPLTARARTTIGGRRERGLMDRPETVGALTELLRGGGYLADRGLATALFVALSLGRPILLEGEVGVGKTEVAKVLAAVFGRRLIRLQCYEGIDTNQALYEWDYARQMLQIRALSERQTRRRRGGRQAVRPEVPARAAAARGGARRRPGRAAHRRGRPRRRRVRGVPARGALRLPDHASPRSARSRPRRRRWSSSPRTAPASCTTR